MKKIRFLWKSTCSTCRNARSFLRDELKVELDERDFVKKPLTAGELRQLFKGRDPRDFLNPKSAAFKARGLADKKLSREEALKLMAEDPNLIKRPLTIFRGEIVAGLDRERLIRLFGKA